MPLPTVSSLPRNTHRRSVTQSQTALSAHGHMLNVVMTKPAQDRINPELVHRCACKSSVKLNTVFSYCAHFRNNWNTTTTMGTGKEIIPGGDRPKPAPTPFFPIRKTAATPLRLKGLTTQNLTIRFNYAIIAVPLSALRKHTNTSATARNARESSGHTRTHGPLYPERSAFCSPSAPKQKLF